MTQGSRCQGDFFMRYDCLPGTVDPRGPKAK